MNRERTLNIVLIAITLATIVFIWSNSLQSVPESQAKSLGVRAQIKPCLGVFVGQGNVTDNLVRKLAHFVEYSALGCELALLLALKKRVSWQPIMNSAFAAMVVALTDETIQIFTGRGSQVQDVWLDFAGACAGILFVLLIRLLITALRRKHKHNHVSK